jgi:hypothetical protein
VIKQYKHSPFFCAVCACRLCIFAQHAAFISNWCRPVKQIWQNLHCGWQSQR